ncbi:MAG: hypothetical protein Q4G68_10910 [Planctomycetia bacterium]|nr:hypothetical protein [Planctomycetia bacterium]
MTKKHNPECPQQPSSVNPARDASQTPQRRFAFLTTIRDDALDDEFDLSEDLDTPDNPDAERLLAWLDGELTPEECREFQAELAASLPLQSMLKQFQRTAELVRQVVPEERNSRVAASTLEMVAVVAADELNARLRQERIRSVLTTLLILTLLALAVTLGFYLARSDAGSSSPPVATNSDPVNPSDKGHGFAPCQPGDAGVTRSGAGRQSAQSTFAPGSPTPGIPKEQPFQRARDFLPEELRNENMTAFQNSFDAFVAARTGHSTRTDGPPSPHAALGDKQGRGEEDTESQMQSSSPITSSERERDARADSNKGAGSERGGRYRGAGPYDRFRPRGFRMIEEYLDSHTDEEIIAKLSPGAQDFLKPLSEKERRCYLGLLLSIEFLQNERKVQELPLPPFEPKAGQKPFPGHLRNPNSMSPGMVRSDPGSDDAGFFWMTESTADLAATLRTLPAERQAELLSLPSDEMYARLLTIHWGFDPMRRAGPFPIKPQHHGE